MDPELLTRAEPIFHGALRLPAVERARFLAQQCAGNGELLAVVSKLLAHAEDKNGVFSPPQNTSRRPGVPVTMAPGTMIGRYELVRSLGHGGMGQVYLARQEEPHRDVALKLLPGDPSDKALSRRFRLEIEILGQLNHPGIAQIFDADTTEDGHLYFAMEYVPGRQLAEFVHGEELGPQEKLKLIVQICDAVQHAHEHGIIHRDLKPSNIMAVRQDDGVIRTWVLDFGIARATGLEESLVTLNTIPGQLVGTLAYMSPEQVNGVSEDLDARSDIYQLGVIAYELLAGRLPLDMETPGFALAMRRISEHEPDKLGIVDSAFRGDIETIVSKAMDKERDRRYGTAGDLAADIKRYLAGEAIHAHPATAIYRLGKAFRRRRSLVLSLVAGMAVAGFLAWFFPHHDDRVFPHSTPKLTKLTPSTDKHFKGNSLSLSPDGQRLAYLLGREVIIREMKTGESNVVVPHISGGRSAYTVSWYPSGNELLVEFYSAEKKFELTRFHLPTRSEEVLYTYDEYAHAVISPDGNLALLEKDKDHELAVLDLSSGDVTTVLRVGEGESLSSPIWGADSRHLYYQRRKIPDDFLESIDFAGNQTVLQSGRFFTFPKRPTLAWLPDGRLLYSVQQHNVTFEFWALPIDTSKGKPTGDAVLVHGLANRAPRDLAYSALSNTLVFTANLWEPDLVLFDLEAKLPLPPQKLKTRGWPCAPVGWLPGGESLLVTEASPTRDAEAFIMNMTTGDMHSIDCCPPNARAIGLTPDGTYLFAMDDLKLIAVPLDCGPVIDLHHELQTQPLLMEVVRSREDANKCYLLSREGNIIHVWNVDLVQGIVSEFKSIETDVNGVYALHNVWAHLSPDGKQFAITEFNTNIKLYDIATDEITVITTDLGTIQSLRWSWDGRWIYCQGLRGKTYPRWLARVNPKTGASEILWHADSAMMFVIRPSPDSKTLAATRLKMGADLYMLEGL